MTAVEQTKNVGVIGLGLMGRAFASNLLSRGYKVHVYNRTRQKAASLVARGAILQPSVNDLASSVDIVMTSLTDQDAIDSIALGENGFLNSMRKGSLWIDLSTIDPTASIRYAEATWKAGVDRLDAPVVGSEDMASKGNLTILVGGSFEVFQRYRYFLNQLGKTITYLGADGSGYKMKLAVNLYLGLIREAFSEALVLSEKQGFDAKTFVEIINSSAHRNAFSEGRGPKIVTRNFDAAFTLNNLIKDLKLADKQASETGAILPMSKVALAEYSKAAENGNGDKDFSVVAFQLERNNTLTLGRVRDREVVSA